MKAERFKKINRGSISDNVMSQLIEAIIEGHLRPGDRIPTELELMEQFGVGRNSIREAIKVLISYGILEIRRAEGTFICAEFSPKLLNPMIYGIILEHRSSKDLIDLRRILEVGSCQLALNNSTDEDDDSLKEALDALIESLTIGEPAPEQVLQADLEFHSCLLKAINNPLLTKIYEMITLLLMRSRLHTIETLIRENNIQYLIDSHSEIYETIKNRNHSGIAEVIENSFLHWSIVLENKIDIQWPKNDTGAARANKA